MATLRMIRRRIRSVKNTAQITRAMELVAGSKMRRAQEHVVSSRPYAEKMHDILSYLSIATKSSGESLHPLLAQHPTGKVCLIMMTSDRGLCGAFNMNIVRTALEFMIKQKDADQDVALVTVGKRGRDFMVRYGASLIADFSGMSDRPSLNDIAPIVRLCISGYSSGTFKSVHLAYSQFVSTMTQKPIIIPVLPIEKEYLIRGLGENPPRTMDYIFEPNAAAILDSLLPRYVEVQIYQALLDSIASEQSARMIAMHAASDNANDIVDDMTMTMNRLRQSAITRELIDITTSAAAIG